MELLKSIVSWVATNWVELGAALALLVGAARAIVKLTPTPKDDSILEKVVEFFKHVGLSIDSPKKTETK